MTNLEYDHEMTNGKLENICKIIKDKDLETKPQISDNIICFLCEAVMINLCNGLCGCQYCWECIESYLDGDEKCCPGQSENCKSQLISIDDNILIDQCVDTKVSRIIVKCPDQSMKLSDESRKIDGVISGWLCNNGDNQFQSFSNGSRNTEINNQEFDDHENESNPPHTEQMMDWMSSFRNELRDIKVEIVNSRMENSNLKKQIDLIKADSNKKQDAISQLQKNDVKKSNQIEDLTKQLKRAEQELSFIRYSSQNDDVNDDVSQYDSPRRGRNIDEIPIEKIVFTAKLDKTNKSIKAMNEMIGNLSSKITDLKTDLDKQNYGEFIWKINNFSEKISEARMATNAEIYSDPFYSHKNGYKMCLRVDPIGIRVGHGSHLGVYFCIMRSPYDDILPWPMKHCVTFSLINQKTGFPHTSRTARFDDFADNFAWNKPVTEKTTGFGYHKFIEMAELLDNTALCKGDQIFIRCSVEMS